MKYRTVFDIIGPVMIGPSSSHTAGAARIGRAARKLWGRMPKEVHITLYGSFAKTYKGHGTDIALVGGLLDFDTFDTRIVDSLDYAREAGMSVQFILSEAIMDHPNTVRLKLFDDAGSLEVVGISIGGGKMELVELNQFQLRLSSNRPALMVLHKDQFGAVAQVASILAKHEINIAYMQVSRKDKGSDALMSIETDEEIDDEVQDEVRRSQGILNVVVL